MKAHSSRKEYRYAAAGRFSRAVATVSCTMALLMAMIIGGQKEAGAALTLETVASGLASPTSITHANDGSGRLFITLQRGKIVIFDGSGILTRPFLDIRALVSCCGSRGLLSMAFHPNYLTNGFFYVNYTDVNGDTVVARYQVSANPNRARPRSQRVILSVTQPFRNHNGGQLQFGPDGMLYIGMGDGGSGGDPGNRAQDPGTLLGKMLRIDVDSGFPYVIPADNPFIGNPAARPEIWGLGLRNPWRFSFDRQTGQMFIGDVGQANWEEINLQQANSAGGENYGWRIMEGDHCFNPATGCSTRGLRRPIIEYNHAEGCAVTGGYRYRGILIPPLVGTYIYADFCSGAIWGAQFQRGVGWTAQVLQTSGFRIPTFGEDESGEIYFADRVTGTIYRIAGLVP